MTIGKTNFWFFNRYVSVSFNPRPEGAFDCPACDGKGDDCLECCGNGIALCTWGSDARCSVYAVALDEDGPLCHQHVTFCDCGEKYLRIGSDVICPKCDAADLRHIPTAELVAAAARS